MVPQQTGVGGRCDHSYQKVAECWGRADVVCDDCVVLVSNWFLIISYFRPAAQYDSNAGKIRSVWCRDQGSSSELTEWLDR